jgi:hypothetical protein
LILYIFSKYIVLAATNSNDVIFQGTPNTST